MAAEKILEKPAVEKVSQAVSQAEKVSSPEGKAERVLASPPKSPEQPRSNTEKIHPAAAAVAPLSDFQIKRAAAIDEILSAGLNEIFLQMNAKEQSEFKKKGEETVGQINGLLDKTKVSISKIIDLIRAWLKLIPGINKFFLEQESKIKADKIIKIKDKF